MKRSGFKRKSYDEILEAKQASDSRRRARTLLGGNSLRRDSKRLSKPLRAKKPINRVGPRTKAWDSERASLKVKFANAGIVTCELRFARCAFDDYLGFAHAKKRGKLPKTELGVVILACNFCHDEIETMPHSDMERIVMSVIAARPVQPK